MDYRLKVLKQTADFGSNKADGHGNKPSGKGAGMQALSIVKGEDEISTKKDPESASLESGNLSGEWQNQELEADDLRPKDSGKEKIREHYQEFGRKFQGENAGQCPLVGYNIHWFYSRSSHAG